MKYNTKPFDLLKFKPRAAFILHLAGYRNRDLSQLLALSNRTIIRYIKAGYKDYPTLAEGVDVALAMYKDEEKDYAND
jgi:hypothetical protein